jgi:RimJ/RimL family protein N-acetyltransferase
MSLIEYWPLFGLRILTPTLELRIPTDDDFPALLDLVIGGIHDPATQPFHNDWTDVPSPQLEWNTLQYWWRSRVGLSPARWDLPFVVVRNGEIVGIQSVGATNFAVRRWASTGSWLGKDHQGAGIGSEMRRAVVDFTFEHLGALSLSSGAMADNIVSHRVSLGLGYAPNGIEVVERRGERTELTRYLLTRERWLEAKADPSSGGGPVDQVEGLDACRAMLGLLTD